MKLYAIATLVILMLLSLAYSQDTYCSLCDNHVACRNDGSWAANCPSGAEALTLSDANINTLLSEHNRVRNLLALGKIPGYKTASKMKPFKWDTELATLAVLNVKQCQMNHDSCRSTVHYPDAGQNLYMESTTGKFNDINVSLKGAVNAWFNEYKNGAQPAISSCCGGSNFSKIGHFLQVAQDQAEAVGCGVARYLSDGWNTTLIACNYSYGNMGGDRVYTISTPTSSCNSVKNTAYSGLCK